MVAEVKSFTSGRGVDVVIDHAGAATWERSLRSLARGGRSSRAAPRPGYAATSISGICSRGAATTGLGMGTKAELLRASALFVRGVFRP
jgi:NADPH:quinone reductase-like Zn-dependent oxidoreductase